MRVRIELFGIARSRAGVAEVVVEAATLGDALRALVDAHPTLAGEVIDGARPATGYLVSLNGERFIEDLSLPLPAEATLLLLSGQAGG